VFFLSGQLPSRQFISASLAAAAHPIWTIYSQTASSSRRASNTSLQKKSSICRTLSWAPIRNGLSVPIHRPAPMRDYQNLGLYFALLLIATRSLRRFLTYG